MELGKSLGLKELKRMTEGEKQYHLDNFKNALLHVSPEYFGIPAIHGQVHMNERAFAFELFTNYE